METVLMSLWILSIVVLLAGALFVFSNERPEISEFVEQQQGERVDLG